MEMGSHLNKVYNMYTFENTFSRPAALWATACLQRLPPRSAFQGPERPPPLPLRTDAAWPAAPQSAAPFTGDSWGTVGLQCTRPRPLHPPCPIMMPALCHMPAPGRPPTSSPSWPRNSLAGRCMPHVLHFMMEREEKHEFLSLCHSWCVVTDKSFLKPETNIEKWF